tara:strand:+ start:523 stop:1071 length:549 start_codon:yes stop_codon:yes gene_type:complete
MKIYTKKGDKGQTSLIGGRRVSKHHLRIEAYGTVDELNSYIGLIRDQDIDETSKNTLIEIQDRLFTIGSQLAAESENSKMKLPDLYENDIVFLENEIDRMDENLETMKSFILPGGHPTVSYTHITRCVCRRAERICVHLANESPVNEKVIRYLNRLSDFLFTLSRKLTKDLGATETPWVAKK